MTNNGSSLIVNSSKLTPHNIYRIKSILSQLFPNAKERFDAKWLNDNIDKQKTQKPFIYQKKYWLRYAGKQGTENHHYTIEAKEEKEKEKLQKVVEKVYKDAKALDYLWAKKTEERYKNFGFESQAEVAIAIELSKRKVLFFSNATCLIPDRYGEKHQKRPDFLVVYKGQTRILEVDGKDFHENAFEDYKRDRLFEKYGLRTTRFTADECLTNPEVVIDEFLDLFNNGNSLEYEIEQVFKHYSKIKTIEDDLDFEPKQTRKTNTAQYNENDDF